MNSGDTMVIDNDGVVIIPKNKTIETVKKAHLQIKEEIKWKKIPYNPYSEKFRKDIERLRCSAMKMEREVQFQICTVYYLQI